MRILHILDHSVPIHTPYSHRTLALLREQRALGWHTSQLTGPAQGMVETEDRNRDQWHFYRTAPGQTWLPAPLHTLRMARRICHAVRLARPAVLHAHPPLLNTLAALRAGRLAGVPVLADLPGRHRDGAITDLLERRSARLAGAVTVDSLAMRAWLVAGGTDPGKIALVPPAASQPRTDLEAAARNAGPMLGCLAPAGDAIDTLLAALPILLESQPRLQLVVAGQLPDDRLAPFAGSIVCVPRGEAAAVRSAADIVLFPDPSSPSLLLPLKPLEAMAHGALVVASDTAMHRETVDHGRNGVLFESGSAVALADAVLGLLAEPGVMRYLRGRAREFAAHERSWRATAQLYGRVYERLIEKGGR